MDSSYYLKNIEKEKDKFFEYISKHDFSFSFQNKHFGSFYFLETIKNKHYLANTLKELNQKKNILMNNHAYHNKIKKIMKDMNQKNSTFYNNSIPVLDKNVLTQVTQGKSVIVQNPFMPNQIASLVNPKDYLSFIESLDIDKRKKDEYLTIKNQPDSSSFSLVESISFSDWLSGHASFYNVCVIDNADIQIFSGFDLFSHDLLKPYIILHELAHTHYYQKKELIQHHPEYKKTELNELLFESHADILSVLALQNLYSLKWEDTLSFIDILIDYRKKSDDFHFTTMSLVGLKNLIIENNQVLNEFNLFEKSILAFDIAYKSCHYDYNTCYKEVCIYNKLPASIDDYIVFFKNIIKKMQNNTFDFETDVKSKSIFYPVVEKIVKNPNFKHSNNNTLNILSTKLVEALDKKPMNAVTFASFYCELVKDIKDISAKEISNYSYEINTIFLSNEEKNHKTVELVKPKVF